MSTEIDPKPPSETLPIKDPPAPVSVIEPEIKKPSDELVPTEPTPEYVMYGDPVADSIVNTLKAAKVDPKAAREIFAEAASELDISKLDVKKLEALVGKDSAELIQLRLDKFFSAKKKAITETVDLVYSVAGSKEAWDKITSWAKEKASKDEEFKTEYLEYAELINSGKTKAKLAALELKKAYESDANNSSLKVTMTEGSKKGSAPIEEGETLSRAEYVELMKAAQKSGNAAEIERLRQKRLHSMQSSV